MREATPTITLLAVGVVLAACGGSVSPDPSVSVIRDERVWIDTSRTTPPTSAYRGAPDRTLRVVLWLPAGATGLPLLIMAHGFGGLPEKFDAFARAVARAGFVVAAPAFPLTNQDAPGGHDPGFRDFVNQPADISFVVTRLFDATQASGDPLAGRLDPVKVAVLGHSLGGTAVVGLTRKSCCRDDRIRATILVAAAVPLAIAFGLDPISTEHPPTLLIHGTADRSVDYSVSATFFDQIDPPRYLLGLTGAGHSEALESQEMPPIAARDAAQRATIAFLNGLFRNTPAELHAVLRSLSAAGNSVKPGELAFR